MLYKGIVMDNFKKISQCPNCGSPLGDNLKFCPTCGKKLTETAAIPVVKEEQTLTCPGCGAVLEPGTLFCPNCGTKTNEKVTPVTPQDTSEKSRICPSCGKSVSKDDVFCPYCSARIDGKVTEPVDQTTPDNMFHCPYCGGLVEKGTRFCPYCSEQISGKKELVISYTVINIIKYALLSVLGLVLCFVLYKVVLQKPIAYNHAIKLKEQEQYEEAYDLFKSLGDYKDCQDQCDECIARIKNSIYIEALQLYGEGKYEAALEKYNKIRGYADVDGMVEQIENTIISSVLHEIVSTNDVLHINTSSTIWNVDWTRNKDGKGHISNITLYVTNDFCNVTINADADYTYSSEEETINDFVVSRINYQSIDVELTGNFPDDKKNDFYTAIQQQCFSGSDIDHNRILLEYAGYDTQNRFSAYYEISINMPGERLDDLGAYSTVMSYDPLTGKWTIVSHEKLSDYVSIRNIHDVSVFIRSIPNKSGEKLGVLDVGEDLWVSRVLEDASAEYGDSEYRWYKVYTTNGSEAWVAERKSQVWYKFY